jgi:hypothetical protein
MGGGLVGDYVALIIFTPILTGKVVVIEEPKPQ